MSAQWRIVVGMEMAGARTEPTAWRYSGRSFTAAEIETIRQITDDPRHATRVEIARAVCAALRWAKPDGQPKLVSCHVALQRLEAHGVIWLPLPTREPVRRRPPARTAAGGPQAPITGTRGGLQALRLAPVTDRAHLRLGALVGRLEGAEAAGLEHSALEELLEAAGRQLGCQLRQDHLGLRALHQRRRAAPLLAEGGPATPRKHLERG